MYALTLARKVAPALPFIFVSGTIGEEYAIRALKNGATDYVLKNNLVRLPPAIERALQDAKERVARLEAETMFRDVMEYAPDPMIVVGADDGIVLANGRCETVFGYDRSELIGQAVEMLVPTGLRKHRAEHRSGFMADPRARAMGAQLKVVAMRSDGQAIPVEISLAPLGTRSEALLVATIRDQTERRAQEDRIARLSRIRDMLGDTNSAIVRIRERQALFDSLCEIARAAGGFSVARVVALDESGRARLASSAGIGRQACLDLLDAYNRDPANADSLIARTLRGARPVISNDLRNDERTRAGADPALAESRALACFPLVVEDRVAGVLVLHAREAGFFDQDEVRLLSEIASNTAFGLELMAKQAKLDYLAYYDALTGLANRALFRDRLSQALEAARQSAATLALVLFDVERFRAINEALGEQAGDEALRVLAERITKGSESGHIARLVGNRFALLVPAIASPSDAVSIMERVAAEVFGPPLTLEGRELKLAAKAGFAVYPDDGANPEMLLHNAEAALTRAKETGQRYLYYAANINARVTEKIELEQRLRRAVERGEIILHYQPKVDLVSRRIVGVEALMRWTDPEGRAVSPAMFVPVLEETRLIIEAGEQAQAAAAATYRHWKAAGLAAPRIAVNVSSVQLMRGSFVADLRKALGSGDDHGVDLEITESLLMQDIEQSIAKLNEARRFGISIALDDFGTGYSSLAYLSRLPIDAVKIDRGFVHGMTRNPNDTSIVSTIISLAQSLRLKVIAEGVETDEQEQLLRLMHCDQMQGFLYSRPLPRDEVAALLARGAPAPG
ncbi:MAG: EAL domain-containing protein, partial [Burkholderiales bacterium]